MERCAERVGFSVWLRVCSRLTRDGWFQSSPPGPPWSEHRHTVESTLWGHRPDPRRFSFSDTPWRPVSRLAAAAPQEVRPVREKASAVPPNRGLGGTASIGRPQPASLCQSVQQPDHARTSQRFPGRIAPRPGAAEVGSLTRQGKRAAARSHPSTRQAGCRHGRHSRGNLQDVVARRSSCRME